MINLVRIYSFTLHSFIFCVYMWMYVPKVPWEGFQSPLDFSQNRKTCHFYYYFCGQWAILYWNIEYYWRNVRLWHTLTYRKKERKRKSAKASICYHRHSEYYYSSARTKNPKFCFVNFGHSVLVSMSMYVSENMYACVWPDILSIFFSCTLLFLWNLYPIFVGIRLYFIWFCVFSFFSSMIIVIFFLRSRSLRANFSIIDSAEKQKEMCVHFCVMTTIYANGRHFQEDHGAQYSII